MQYQYKTHMVNKMEKANVSYLGDPSLLINTFFVLCLAFHMWNWTDYSAFTFAQILTTPVFMFQGLGINFWGPWNEPQ